MSNQRPNRKRERSESPPRGGNEQIIPPPDEDFKHPLHLFLEMPQEIDKALETVWKLGIGGNRGRNIVNYHLYQNLDVVLIGDILEDIFSKNLGIYSDNCFDEQVGTLKFRSFPTFTGFAFGLLHVQRLKANKLERDETELLSNIKNAIKLHKIHVDNKEKAFNFDDVRELADRARQKDHLLEGLQAARADIRLQIPDEIIDSTGVEDFFPLFDSSASDEGLMVNPLSPVIDDAVPVNQPNIDPEEEQNVDRSNSQLDDVDPVNRDDNEQNFNAPKRQTIIMPVQRRNTSLNRSLSVSSSGNDSNRIDFPVDDPLTTPRTDVSREDERLRRKRRARAKRPTELDLKYQGLRNLKAMQDKLFLLESNVKERRRRKRRKNRAKDSASDENVNENMLKQLSKRERPHVANLNHILDIDELESYIDDAEGIDDFTIQTPRTQTNRRTPPEDPPANPISIAVDNSDQVVPHETNTVNRNTVDDTDQVNNTKQPDVPGPLTVDVPNIPLNQQENVDPEPAPVELSNDPNKPLPLPRPSSTEAESPPPPPFIDTPSPMMVDQVIGLDYTPMSKHSVMSSLSAIHTKLINSNKVHSQPITFKDLAPVDRTDRKQAAMAFAQVLELSKMGYVKLLQLESYNTIKIELTADFDHSMEKPEFDVFA